MTRYEALIVNRSDKLLKSYIQYRLSPYGIDLSNMKSDKLSWTSYDRVVVGVFCMVRYERVSVEICSAIAVKSRYQTQPHAE